METSSKKKLYSSRKNKVLKIVKTLVATTIIAPVVIVVLPLSIIVIIVWETILSILSFERPEYSKKIEVFLKKIKNNTIEWWIFIFPTLVFISWIVVIKTIHYFF